MNTLSGLRLAIDALDHDLVQLLVRRFRLTDEVAEAKRISGAPVLDPSREASVLSGVANDAGDDLAPALTEVYATILKLSKIRQQQRLTNV